VQFFKCEYLLFTEQAHAQSHLRGGPHRRGPAVHGTGFRFGSRSLPGQGGGHANLREYNGHLQELLDKEELTAGDLEKVHQLTYTLENALKRINTELGGIAGDLETVHLASERREVETVRAKGRAYIDQVDTLID